MFEHNQQSVILGEGIGTLRAVETGRTEMIKRNFTMIKIESIVGTTIESIAEVTTTTRMEKGGGVMIATKIAGIVEMATVVKLANRDHMLTTVVGLETIGTAIQGKIQVGIGLVPIMFARLSQEMINMKIITIEIL